MDNARYLEIGTWKGSSVCSAMVGNKATVVCIDNCLQNDFLINFNTFKGENNAIFIENDCFNVDVFTLPKFNVYMYDGDHTSESHYKALIHFYDCLDDTFIYIVDDWNDKRVRDGTIQAIENLNLETIYENEIRLTYDNTHTPAEEASQTWWNGIYVAVLKKQSAISCKYM